MSNIIMSSVDVDDQTPLGHMKPVITKVGIVCMRDWHLEGVATKISEISCTILDNDVWSETNINR